MAFFLHDFYELIIEKSTFISTVAAASWAIMVMLALCAAVLCAQHAQLEGTPGFEPGTC